jgi:hypothetical protein|tara:strand:+ start:3114 stop:3515 length:402 start_codon:yes stop_codon:yes gene_type:complete
MDHYSYIFYINAGNLKAIKIPLISKSYGQSEFAFPCRHHFLFAKTTNQTHIVNDMKYKLFALLAASFTMVASGQETKEAPAEATKEDVSKEVVVSKVAASIAPVVQKFEGEKYVPTKLAGNPDYYIIYFTASW